eukprot:353-Heterococcus_DN1.PRE.1
MAGGRDEHTVFSDSYILNWCYSDGNGDAPWPALTWQCIGDLPAPLHFHAACCMTATDRCHNDSSSGSSDSSTTAIAAAATAAAVVVVVITGGLSDWEGTQGCREVLLLQLAAQPQPQASSSSSTLKWQTVGLLPQGRFAHACAPLYRLQPSAVLLVCGGVTDSG